MFLRDVIYESSEQFGSFHDYLHETNFPDDTVHSHIGDFCILDLRCRDEPETKVWILRREVRSTKVAKSNLYLICENLSERTFLCVINSTKRSLWTILSYGNETALFCLHMLSFNYRSTLLKRASKIPEGERLRDLQNCQLTQYEIVISIQYSDCF